MTPKKESNTGSTKPLRIRFAEALGWKLEAYEQCGIKWIPPSGSYLYPWHKTREDAWRYATIWMDPRLPDPADDNHVREALMGMTDEEWRSFSEKLYSLLRPATTISVIEQILKTQPSTLAELYCEMKGVK